MAQTREEKLAYQREWYQQNKQRHIENVKVRNKQYSEALRDEIRQMKGATPCTDCHLQYPYYVMQFDHLSDKVGNVSDLLKSRTSRAAVMREIEKCEVVCSNCHAIRTHMRR